MPNTPPNLIAGETIRPSRFVRLDPSAAKTILEGEANDILIGVAQEGARTAPLNDLVTSVEAAQAGESVQIYGIGDICLLEAGAEIATNDRLKSDSVGRGTPIATTGTTIQYIGAVALEPAAAAGTLILVQVQVYSERPALT